MIRAKRNFVRPAAGILFLAAGVFQFCLPARESLAKTPEHPNVILVITDDQGYGDLGCHGNKIIRTPHLDQLYRESVRLTDFHVSPCCTPTRAALMTGRNPVAVGAWGTTWGRSLPHRDAGTIADMFTAAGYRTACVGKWHLGDNYPYRPQDRGFQEVLIHGGGGVGQAPDSWGNDYFDDTYFRNGNPEKHRGYCTDVWFDEAWAFIREQSDLPFFVYLTTNAPHGPYLVDESYHNLYAEQKDCPHPAFYGMITNIDENMGRLMKRLDQAGLAGDTILIFMTDNGTSAGFRGGKGFNAGMRGTKGSLYDGGHRVPFFVRWPKGKLPEGADVSTLTAHIDVIPTLAELCEIDIPDKVKPEGVSLASLLRGKTRTLPDRNIFVQYHQSPLPPEKGRGAVLSQRWRLINDRELYDIKADPGQQRDVAQQNPDVLRQLRQAYEDWWRDASKGFDTFNSIVVGHDAENPTKLCSFDWHTKTAWSQRQVSAGMKVNGFWAVDAALAGGYDITLRRWPEEAKTPINEALPGGKSITASLARIEIGDIEREMSIPPSATEVTFNLQLPKGETTLQTWLIDSDTGESRGAYYVDIRRH